MRQNTLIFFFLGLLSITLHRQSLTTQTFSKRKSISFTHNHLKLLNSFVFGAKEKLKKDTINTFRSFGLMHLLTPSGMHLSSLLVFFKFFPRLRYIIIFLFFISSFFVPEFWSIKRVLIFSLIAPMNKDSKMTFIMTILLAIILGHYQSSPLSFCFSFLFWGTIVFHEKSRMELIFKLFILQLVVSLFFNQELNGASLILNPLLSFLFTLSFPILCLGAIIYPLGHCLEFMLLEVIVSFLKSLNSISFLTIQSSMIIFILAVMLLTPQKKLLIIILLLIPIQYPNITKKIILRSKIVTLPQPGNFLESKGEKIVFTDSECKRRGIYYFCKKKPSTWGGPMF